MKMKHFFIAAALLMCGQCYAQSGRGVHGTIIDSLKQPLPSGIIKLVSETRDSMITTADGNGNFVFRPVKGRQITVTAYSMGYLPATKHYTLQANDTDLGNIALMPGQNLLKELAVTKPANVVLHIDTVEYKAKPYKPRENASMDSILKKLPQIDVDTNGNITYRGRQVTKVRHNDEDFPRTDIQTAIKNLPPDIVESIQVIDDYGDDINSVGDKKILDMDKIVPVIYKEDTIMYNVAAYKTGGKGRLMDLLKKLPGINVDADGNILAQGRPVIRVSVDGKAYSNNKLKRAMKNLHADLISKVLVIDDYGDAALDGLKVSKPKKAIDIVTKKQ